MSTKTEHLGLHQWEPEDKFLREDFNGDFAKIDAGVKAVGEANRLVKLTELALTEDKSQLALDLSGINWAEYLEVLIWVRAVGAGSGGLGTVRVNGLSAQDAYSVSNINSGGTYEQGYIASFFCYPIATTTLLRIHCLSDQLSIQSETVNGSSHLAYQGAVRGGLALAEVQKLSFLPPSATRLAAGTSAFIYGVRR